VTGRILVTVSCVLILSGNDQYIYDCRELCRTVYIGFTPSASDAFEWPRTTEHTYSRCVFIYLPGVFVFAVLVLMLLVHVPL
jgi:hypothetical protein